MKIRFLKHWENAAKNVDFLMILNFLHMVTLTSISTKKMKIWNFSIKFKFLHMLILKFFQQFFCFFYSFRFYKYGVFDVHFNKKHENLKLLHPILILTYGDFDIIFNKFLFFPLIEISYIWCFGLHLNQNKWKRGIFTSNLKSYMWWF